MARDPREAVLDSLCAPAGIVTVTGVSPGGVVSSRVRGGPRSSADPESVVFLKERTGTGKRLYAVAYTVLEGRSYLDVVGVAQDNHGSWAVNCSAGGSGAGPPRDRLWANLGGWWNAGVFCAGGRVIGEGAELGKRVQLNFADGTMVTDTIDDGLVLFLVEHAVDLPGEAQILSHSGELLASHSVFDSSRRPTR